MAINAGLARLQALEFLRAFPQPLFHCRALPVQNINECSRLIISHIACFDRTATTLRRHCLPHGSTNLKASIAVLFFFRYGVNLSEFAVLGSVGAQRNEETRHGLLQALKHLTGMVPWRTLHTNERNCFSRAWTVIQTILLSKQAILCSSW